MWLCWKTTKFNTTVYRFFTINQSIKLKMFKLKMLSNFQNRLPGGGKGWLHFVQEKGKVDCVYYVGYLLPNLVEDCSRLLPTGFIFQQDVLPAHTVHSGPTVQISSQRTNGLQIRQWTVTCQVQCWTCWRLTANLKPKTFAKLKEALQVTWGNLPQGPIDIRQGCERLLKATEGLFWSWRWTLRAFTVTIQNSGIWSLVNCVV